MVSRKRASGIIGTMIALQIVVLLTNLESWTLIRKIDNTTTSNSELLAVHGVKLLQHEQNFQSILEGTFKSKDFAFNVRKFFPNENR